MNKRQREVERMVTDLGLVITGFRTNGTSHWRVDVETPDGKHQRPFTFPTSGHDGPRRYDEISMLKRWRREVAPELEVAQEAGTLRPGRKLPLAEKLEELGIPLKREQPPAPGKLTIPAHFAPGTPEAALAQSLSPPAPQPAQQQEPQVQITDNADGSTSPGRQNGYTRGKSKEARKTDRQNMTFAEVMKFGAWMNKDRLEGYYTKDDFLDHASHVLAFRVTPTALDAWLEENGVSMPKRPEPVKPKSALDVMSDDIAAIALAITESIPDGPHRNLLLSIVERRTKG
jgi:hypothetical protein